MKKIAILIAGMLTVWALTVVPGYYVWGKQAWLHSGVALALCLLPAVATMAWVVFGRGMPEQQLVAVLGGTGIRLAVSLGGAFFLVRSFPNEFPKTFWAWVVVYYLAALTLEVTLVVRAKEHKSLA